MSKAKFILKASRRLAFFAFLCHTNGRYFLRRTSVNTCYETMLSCIKKDGFIAYYDHKIPTRRFLRDVEALCCGLNKLGLSKGDVVTVYLPTCPQSVAAFYACSKLGLVASFVHPLTPVDELASYIAQTDSKALLFYDVLVKDERPLAKLSVTLVRCSIADYVTFRKPAYALYARAIGKRINGIFTYKQLISSLFETPVQGDGNDVVCYMHSGGTSGQPKIVKLSNNAFNDTATTIVKMYNPEHFGDNMYLVTLPVFHAYGLCASVHTGVVAGFNLGLIPKYEVKAVRRYFAKYNITAWAVVPAMLTKLICANAFDDKRFGKLDVIWCGGDVISESMAEQVDGILAKYSKRPAQLMRGYGLTETCGVCIVNNYEHYAKNSCGRPIDGCQVEIWDDDGNALGSNQVGEIVLTARGIMSGYLDEDDVFVKDGKWIKTGDVGYVDEQGFVYVVDRKKRMVKIAAVNVFPSEVEACINKLSFVSETCVVGVKVNGKQYLKAFVTLTQAMSDDEATRRIVEHCKANLIRYAVPRFVQVLDVMPRTKLAKIDYKSLEQM